MQHFLMCLGIVKRRHVGIYRHKALLDLGRVNSVGLQHPDICQQDVAVLDLMLGTIWSDIHSVHAFYEITLTENGTNDGQSAAGNDAFVCKFDSKIIVHMGTSDGVWRQLLLLYQRFLTLWLHITQKVKIFLGFKLTSNRDGTRLCKRFQLFSFTD